MEWLEITIRTVPGGIESVSDMLTAAGMDGFIIDDEADFHTFLEENRKYWDYVDEGLEEKMKGLSQIRLFIENGPDAPERITALREQLNELRRRCPDTDLGSLEISCAQMQEEDWENSWKKYYNPISVGKKLQIIPEWMTDRIEAGRVPVILDPGMIFGTGAHASTQMCLAALEELVRGGERILDLGSGSGILSIAALRLGAARAVGVDIDPKAEDIARDNAALNGFGPEVFEALTGDVIGDSSMPERLGSGYPVVCANIVADVIIPLSAFVPRFLAPNGAFLCSGILDTRLPDVIRAIENAGMTVVARDQKNDWCCLTAKRKTEV